MKKQTVSEHLPGVVPFEFQAKQIRVVQEMDGIPWWVAKDVCDVLEHTDARKAVAGLDDDERKKVPVIDSLTREQETWAINESGLYTLIIRSNKPQAKPFRKWVTSVVLPAIRKTGCYSVKPDPKSPAIEAPKSQPMNVGDHILVPREVWEELKEPEVIEKIPYRHLVGIVSLILSLRGGELDVVRDAVRHVEWEEQEDWPEATMKQTAGRLRPLLAEARKGQGKNLPMGLMEEIVETLMDLDKQDIASIMFRLVHALSLPADARKTGRGSALLS